MKRVFALSLVFLLAAVAFAYHRARIAGRDARRAERLVGEGDRALRAGKLELRQASLAYSEALRSNPEEARALLGLARVRFRSSGTVWAALPYYLKAADLAAAESRPPGPADVKIAATLTAAGDDNLAAAGLDVTFLGPALDAYVAAAIADHAAAGPYLGIARVLTRLGHDPYAALRYYREAVRRTPYQPQIHYELARRYRKLGALGPALEHARAAGSLPGAAELVEQIEAELNR